MSNIKPLVVFSTHVSTLERKGTDPTPKLHTLRSK